MNYSFSLVVFNREGDIVLWHLRKQQSQLRPHIEWFAEGLDNDLLDNEDNDIMDNDILDQ